MLLDEDCLVFQPFESAYLAKFFVFYCNVWRCEKSSAMQRFVVGWIVPLLLKYLGAIVFWVKQSRKIASPWRGKHYDPLKCRDLWKATINHLCPSVSPHVTASIAHSVFCLSPDKNNSHRTWRPTCVFILKQRESPFLCSAPRTPDKIIASPERSPTYPFWSDKCSRNMSLEYW